MKKWFFFLIVSLLLLPACGGSQQTKPAPSTPNTPSTPSSSQRGPVTTKKWDKPPAMTIDPNKKYQATISTNMGDITIDLFAKEAPKTVNNFVFLAKQNFYNNIIFHRIIKNFMIQTGDPTGTGAGDPGYKFADELNSPYKYEKGIVAMANAGPNTNGSQFFICNGKDSESLNASPNYTIFGRVTAGMDTVDKISNVPVKANSMGEQSQPTEEVFIKTITIKEQ